MENILTVVGGTYFETCIEPQKEVDLFGSGLRGAAALAGKGFTVELFSCLAKADEGVFNSYCETFEITPIITLIDNTVIFGYYHPLSTPEFINPNQEGISIPAVRSRNILFYGMIEAEASVHGNYVVYDPQNHRSFTETGSTADHLAIVLNRKEAYLLSGLDNTHALSVVGHSLLTLQQAEVVIIKDGSRGALVVEANAEYAIPVYDSDTVWPIGSGDVFSAIFAWQWVMLKQDPFNAAQIASKYTATYCNSGVLPVPDKPVPFDALSPSSTAKKIYLAGPFFTMSQRWLVNEVRMCLIEFGNEVFSPFHDLGLAQVQGEFATESDIKLAEEDMEAIKRSDLVFAVLCDHDPGTLFEIGYARALNKKVIIYAEKPSNEDLFMMYGSKCTVISDFSTAIYKASW